VRVKQNAGNVPTHEVMPWLNPLLPGRDLETPSPFLDNMKLDARVRKSPSRRVLATLLPQRALGGGNCDAPGKHGIDFELTIQEAVSVRVYRSAGVVPADVEPSGPPAPLK